MECDLRAPGSAGAAFPGPAAGGLPGGTAAARWSPGEVNEKMMV